MLQRLLRQSHRDESNNSVETNRRPACPMDAGREFESALCAPRLLSAVVAYCFRGRLGGG